MLFWKSKADWHIAIAKMYMPMLQDENKMKHPRVYRFADKRWRYHTVKALQEVRIGLNQLMKEL